MSTETLPPPEAVTPAADPGEIPGVAGMALPVDYRVYRWGWAPQGLATRRQLAAAALRPGSQEPVAQITFHRGQRVAYLYRVDAAEPKHPPTPAQLAALGQAMRVRRTCTSCGTDAGYCLPTRYSARGERHCLDCLQDTTTRTAENTDHEERMMSDHTEPDPKPQAASAGSSRSAWRYDEAIAAVGGPDSETVQWIDADYEGYLEDCFADNLPPHDWEDFFLTRLDLLRTEGALYGQAAHLNLPAGDVDLRDDDEDKYQDADTDAAGDGGEDGGEGLDPDLYLATATAGRSQVDDQVDLGGATVTGRGDDASWVPEPEYYPPGHPDHVFPSKGAEDAFWNTWEAAEDARAEAETAARYGGPQETVLPGSDDVEAAWRQWAVDQVKTGLLTRDEAVAQVPGAAGLIDRSLARANGDTAGSGYAAGSGSAHEVRAQQGLRQWAAGHDSWLQDRRRASPLMRYALDAQDEARALIEAAEPGTRFEAATRALGKAFSQGDGTQMLASDGFYGVQQAASLLGALGYDSDQVVAALGERVNEYGSIDTWDFAAALGDLVGEPDKATGILEAGRAAAATELAAHPDPEDRYGLDLLLDADADADDFGGVESEDLHTAEGLTADAPHLVTASSLDADVPYVGASGAAELTPTSSGLRQDSAHAIEDGEPPPRVVTHDCDEL